MATSKDLFQEAMHLSPLQRAKLTDRLLSSLDMPDKTLDKKWAEEVEDRIEAYEKGDLKIVSLEDVLKKYK